MDGPLGFPRQLWVLCGSIFLFVSGLNMCLPFVSLYLKQTLGVSATTIGAVIGIMTFLGLPMQLVGGSLIDRIGRRPVLLLGGVAAMTTYVAIAFAPSLWIAALALGVEAVFGWSLVLTANNTMTADLAPPGRQTEAFGLRAAAAGAGNASGPFAASLVLSATGSFRACFLTGVAVMALFAVAVLLVIRETNDRGRMAPRRHRDATVCPAEPLPLADPPPIDPLAAAPVTASRARTSYAVVLSDRLLVVFLLATLPATYCYAQIFVTLPIMLRDVHDVSPQQWGRLLAVFALTTSALTIPLTRSVRHRNGMGVTAAGCLLMGCTLAALAFVPTSRAALYLLMALLAVGVCFHISATPAVIARLAPAGLAGRYMGAWGFAYVGGYGIGTLLGGRALDALGAHGAYFAVGAVGVAGAMLLGTLVLATRSRRSPSAA